MKEFYHPGGKNEKIKNRFELLGSGSIGFDFIFVKEKDENGEDIKVPYLIEMNGTNSGFGMRKVPTKSVDYLRQLFANIRGYSFKSDQDFIDERKSFDEEIKSFKEISDKYSGKKEGLRTEEIVDYLVESNKFRAKLKEYKHINKFVKVNWPTIDGLLDNKFLQKYFLNRSGVKYPKLYSKISKLNFAGNEDLLGQNLETEELVTNSRTGKWIIKPILGAHGDDIEIIDDIVLEDLKYKDYLLKDTIMRIYQEKYGDKYSLNDLLIEEFFEASGAESEKETDLKDNPSSLRLILDYNCYINNDGTLEIETTYSDGFQRVSPNKNEEGSGVVNSSKGALSRVATKNEVNLCYGNAVKLLEAMIKFNFDDILATGEKLFYKDGV